MRVFPLRCRDAEFQVKKTDLLKLELFNEHTDLLTNQCYVVRSAVSESVCGDFVRAIKGEEMDVTRENFAGLRSLCDEFGFAELEERLGAFGEADAGAESDRLLRRDVFAVLRRVSDQEREIASLKSELVSVRRGPDGNTLLGQFQALMARVSGLEAELRELAGRVDGIGDDVFFNLPPGITAMRETVGRIRSEDQKGAVPMKREFKFIGHAFHGIIAALSRGCGGNVADKGVVAVTARDRYRDYFHEMYVLDLEDKGSHYCSGNEPGGWFCLDFKCGRVSLAHYSIRTDCGERGSSHLKSWVVEGSLDGHVWSELDRRENNDDLNGPYKEKTFAVPNSCPFRYIRLRMIGKNHLGGNCLYCSAFEVFGTLMA